MTIEEVLKEKSITTLEKVSNKGINFIEELLNHGMDVDEFFDGATLLMYAVAEEKVNIVKFLLEHGADVNLKATHKQLEDFTALHFTIASESFQIVKLLLKNGAEINAVDNTNSTVLFKASAREKVNLVKLFLENRADVDIANNNNMTALLVALRNNNIDIAEVLIEKGAGNKFELERASLNGWNDVVDYFIENKTINIRSTGDIVEKFYKGFISDLEKGQETKYETYIDYMKKSYPESFFEYDEFDEHSYGSYYRGTTEDYEKYLKIYEHYGFYLDSSFDKEWFLDRLEIVKKLIDNGANIKRLRASKQFRLELAMDRSESENSYWILDSFLHSPIKKENLEELNKSKKLVKILTNFTIDTPIKYTTHSWDFGDIQKEYGDFQGFLNRVLEQWKHIEGELKELSPHLHTKIYDFLLNVTTSKNWCSEAHINVGWSSLEGLELWCDKGNKPCDFKLPQPYITETQQPPSSRRRVSLTF